MSRPNYGKTAEELLDAEREAILDKLTAEAQELDMGYNRTAAETSRGSIDDVWN